MAFSQKQIIIGAAILFCSVMALRSCTRDPVIVTSQLQPQTQQQVQVEREYIQQQQPGVVVVQQPPQTVYQHDSGITSGHVAAGALGYMLGRSNSNSYNNRPTVNKYYNKKVYVRKSSNHK